MATQVKTVADLRAYLEKLEAGWTKNDTYHLGDFEDQQIYALIDGGRYAPPIFAHDVGGEIIIFTKTPNICIT